MRSLPLFVLNTTWLSTYIYLINIVFIKRTYRTAFIFFVPCSYVLNNKTCFLSIPGAARCEISNRQQSRQEERNKWIVIIAGVVFRATIIYVNNTQFRLFFSPYLLAFRGSEGGTSTNKPLNLNAVVCRIYRRNCHVTLLKRKTLHEI